MKTVDFLDAIRIRYSCSDYKAAQLLKLTQAAVSSYRVGKTCFDDEIAIRVAALLDIPAEHVIACVHAERAKSAEVKKVWEKIALATRAAVVAVGTFGAVMAPHSPVDKNMAVYYVK